jgi:hypothetical protein
MSHLVHRRLRAPQEDGAALIGPPLSRIPSLVGANRLLLRNYDYDCQGQSLGALSRDARSTLAQQAIAYCLSYRDVSFLPGLSKNPPFLVAGHQPELYHAGVWFKSFLLSSLGQRIDAVPINLIIDTDVVRSTSIRVPVRVASQCSIENISFDAVGEPIPFEERAILDSWLFDSFDQRVSTACEGCGVGGREPYERLIERLWMIAAPIAAAANRKPQAPQLGRVLAQARHELESLLGLNTLELPLSSVAQSRQFRQFMVHLLAQLPRFWRNYNSALAEFRQVNHVRSHTHPVPSLEETDEWLEAPFFVWTTVDPRRRQLYVRQARQVLLLSSRQGIEFSLDISPDRSADRAVEQLATAEARGIKIRPRALITTMYARLVLSDLFIHGIGGAKYDELTDLIIRRFFGIEPPAYVTATTTFRLPIDRPDVSLDDVRSSARRIRELRYRPESFFRDPLIAGDAERLSKLAALVAEKRDYLDQHDLRRCSQDVFDRLDRLNRAMHDLLRPVGEQLRARHAELIAQAKQSQLLGSRDFSFVLFPSEFLPARLLDLCKLSS